MFVKHFQIKTFLTSWKLVGGGTLVCFLLAFLPHITPPREEIFFDISMVGLALCSWYCGLSSALGLKIVKSVASTYSAAMGWFGACLAVVAFFTGEMAVVLYVMGKLQGFEAMVAMSPVAISETLMLVSGYVFKRDTQR